MNTLNHPPLPSLKSPPLKSFLSSFDITKPNWKSLPYNFPDCDTTNLSSNETGKFNAIKTMWEINHPKKTTSHSRIWQDPKGYQYLGVWQNAAILRILIRKFTLTLPLKESRLKAQMDDAARSVKRNIEEGWKRPTTSEYLNFLGYAQASLEEVKGDINDCKIDGFLSSKPLSTLKGAAGIDLKVTKGPQKGRVWGEPTDLNHPYHKPLSSLNSHTLTYEIFMELINKTDYLLRSLVKSLEKKMESVRQYYKVEQSRLRKY